MLEQLVLYYGKPQYWHDLLQLGAKRKRPQRRTAARHRAPSSLVGDMKAPADYIEGAQAALVAEYPNDAKTILDKGNSTKILNVTDERVGRLGQNDERPRCRRCRKSDAVGAEGRERSKRERQARPHLLTYAKHKGRETAVRAGMKGKLHRSRRRQGRAGPYLA